MVGRRVGIRSDLFELAVSIVVFGSEERERGKSTEEGSLGSMPGSLHEEGD